MDKRHLIRVVMFANTRLLISTALRTREAEAQGRSHASAKIIGAAMWVSFSRRHVTHAYPSAPALTTSFSFSYLPQGKESIKGLAHMTEGKFKAALPSSTKRKAPARSSNDTHPVPVKGRQTRRKEASDPT
jgi:hypothetical protein